MEPKREYTIKLRFGAKARNPNNAEIFKFFNKQGWTSEDLSAMYRDDHSVFVRFKTEPMMRGALTDLGPQVKFDYDDGTSMEVQVQAAAGTFKYVRIFGLPPEVDDRHIVTVMSKYGAIQQLVRERYPVETGFPIWNGVRGLHIELVAEIPAQLTIQHCKARIYYDGLQNKCFGCGALDHLKAACPKRNSVNNRLAAAATPADGTFASIVANGTPVKPVDAPSPSGMVVLNPKTPAPQSKPNLESSNLVELPSMEGGSSSPLLPTAPESTTPKELPVLPLDGAAEESGDQSMDEDDDNQQNEGEMSPNDADPMETDGTWTEAKGKAKKGKGKRGRPKKQPESDTSDADARGGKQFIVPAPSADLLAALALPKPTRPQTRSASEQRKPNDHK